MVVLKELSLMQQQKYATLLVVNQCRVSIATKTYIPIQNVVVSSCSLALAKTNQVDDKPPCFVLESEV